MDAQLTKIERLLIRFLCVFALVMVGFAHKVPTLIGKSAATEVAQYILPDGSVPTLCITLANDHVNHDGKGPNHHQISSVCEACRLAASTVLPQQADDTGQPTRFYEKAVHLALDATPVRRLFPPNAAPRAPPFSMTDMG